MPRSIILDGIAACSMHSIFAICSPCGIFRSGDTAMPSARKVTLFLLLTALLSLPVQATQNINTQFLKKTIVYPYRGDTAGHPDPGLPLGTGFLVQVPLLSNPNRGYLVLATARHMVDPAW